MVSIRYGSLALLMLLATFAIATGRGIAHADDPASDNGDVVGPGGAMVSSEKVKILDSIPDSAKMGPIDGSQSLLLACSNGDEFEIWDETLAPVSGSTQKVKFFGDWEWCPHWTSEECNILSGYSENAWLGSTPYNPYYNRLDGSVSGSGIGVSASIVFAGGSVSGGSYTGPDVYNDWWELHSFGTGALNISGLTLYQCHQSSTGLLRLYSGGTLYVNGASDTEWV